LIRRAGLLPGGIPDGLGQDDTLMGTCLPHTVMVFFADPPESLYQLEQWYPALRELDSHHRVVVVLQDSRTARAVRRDSALDAIVIARYTTMDDILSRSDIKVALYVNHSPENFSNLRFNGMVHASLMHGDSDKAVTVSHQTNAYDYSLVAGQAAIDRMATYSTFYDASIRCIAVGRPQIDDQLAALPRGPRQRPPGTEPTVLYAPTWEGAQPSAAYGSVDTHGVALVRRFLGAGWTVIYRPHPLAGVRDGNYAAADRAIRESLTRAASAQRPHRVDDGVPIAASFGDADLLICDVSGLAVDWLAIDRPLVITRPARPQVDVATSPLTARMPDVAVTGIPYVVDLAREQVERDPLREERRSLVEHYLGDTAPGVATARFVAAVERLMAIRDREHARLAGLRAGRG
jgi:hypothetical protein